LRKIFLSILVSIAVNCLFAQNKYWVTFTDKDNSIYSLDKPNEFLSQAAIDRRLFFDIPMNNTDLPVNENYIQTVESYDAVSGKKSKWLNAAYFYSDNPNFIAEISQLEFVKEILIFNIHHEKLHLDKLKIQEEAITNQVAELEYGYAVSQIDMLNGRFLHEQDFQGQNIQIAVMDNGFQNVDSNRYFDTANLENRIHGVYDFVEDTAYVFGNGDHGGYVLSTMVANISDTLVGTAPQASYYLFSTEDENSEGVQEEINWTLAAEYTDSALGNWVIITTSLGYSNGFTDGSADHSYSDMDGNTTIITKAADLAASKGILVINSAGNEGTSAWKYITAPADGDSVLAIGAVDSEGVPATFSSYGPSADGDVKPNVCAQGQGVIAVNYDETLRSINGTSFSCPITSGMAACLWQAFPEKNNMEIFQAIEMSAHLYYAPEEQYGFGIPNFKVAYDLLSLDETVIQEDFLVYPNPVQTDLHIYFTNEAMESYDCIIADMSGKKWLQIENINDSLSESINVSNLPSGVYIVMIQQGKTKYEQKIIVK